LFFLEVTQKEVTVSQKILDDTGTVSPTEDLHRPNELTSSRISAK